MESTQIKLKRAYGKDPNTNKPYPIGSVLTIGKEIPENDLGRILSLGTGEPYTAPSGFVAQTDHERVVNGMREKAGQFQQQATQYKELLYKVLEKVDITPLTVEELKQVSTFLELSGLGNANKDALIAAIQKKLEGKGE